MSIILGLIVLGILIVVIWRFSSRRWILPCPAWLGWLIELDNPFTKINHASVIIDHLDLESGMNVLDVGCGPGRLTIPIAKVVGTTGNVTAVDIQPKMLQQVQEKAQSSNLHNIHYLQTNIGDGDLKYHEYDRALLVSVLGEIPDRKKALKEIFNALKPGGILGVTEVIFDPHFQRRSTVYDLAIEVGFKEKRIIGNCFAFTILLQKP